MPLPSPSPSRWAISASIGGAHVAQVQVFWAGTSYLLACTAVLLLWAALSDVFGRRLVLMVALIVFAAGSVICAVANTVLIAGRTVQGLGGGGVLGLTTVLITDLAPLRERAGLYALISSAWAVGSTTGPIIGGGYAIGVKLKTLDYFGSVLFVASITILLVAITLEGYQSPWASWHILVSLCLGAAGRIGVVAYEYRGAARPFIPVYIFRNYSTTAVYAGSFAHGLVLYSLVYYMPECFQAMLGYSPLIAGVAALAQTATVVPCAIFVGAVVSRTSRYRWAVWAGWVLATLGCGLLILLNVDTSIPAWIFLSAVSGLAMGVLFPSIALALQASVPPADVAMAATLVLFFRSFGQAVGVAIGGSILDNHMHVELRRPQMASLLPPELANIGVVTLVSVVKTMRADSPLVLALKSALVRTFQVIWATMCGISGVTMLTQFTIKEYSMDQEHVTDHRFLAEKQPTGDRNRTP
ncbi:major facilitator superfamily domain-containing protein [Corynascus novoguineensis]|uniref:Major facilitator superfamily domain-containing protein n=1 Tax=Corynascus novoguineensis TaxID=1126955 RepID=A0AAN7HF72_9PEZI|nr:major facilitator superfamily domain-containing protein [Corynascus novoguineensis]